MHFYENRIVQLPIFYRLLNFYLFYDFWITLYTTFIPIINNVDSKPAQQNYVQQLEGVMHVNLKRIKCSKFWYLNIGKTSFDLQ